MQLQNSQPRAKAAIRKMFGSHLRSIMMDSISQFIQASTEANGAYAQIVTQINLITKYSNVLIVMSTIKRIWTVNIEAKPDICINQQHVTIVIQMEKVK
jgi:hypothetical protein